MINIAELYTVYQNHPIVCTDTRNIADGCLFFALKGANFDANTFTREALEKGAAYVIIDNENYSINERTILVNDVLETLQALATYHRSQWQIPVIGLTGTNGKTTTKELINSVLSEKYKTYATAGNLNNHIGVPLTILNKPLDCEIAIIEMGANHPFEIEFLCKIAQPTHGLITNVGKAHLEGFGGFEGVIKTKGELYEWLNAHHGVVFIQGDNDYLEQMRSKLLKASPKTIIYGTQARHDMRGKIVRSEPYLTLKWYEDQQSHTVQSQLTGGYNFENILASIAIGHFFGLNTEEINRGIEKYRPNNQRSQILQLKSNTLICDYYNANPSSMMAALDNLAAFNSFKRVSFLGDMFELGDVSNEEHLGVIQKALNVGIEICVFIGTSFFAHAKDFPDALFFKDTVSAIAHFQNQAPITNKVVLIKGSRGMKMEQLLEIFKY